MNPIIDELEKPYIEKEIPELKVNIGEHKDSLFMGEEIIPASFSVDNNSGEYDSRIVLVDPKGNEHEYTEGFIPEIKGEWKVSIIAKDMIGREASSTYSVDVSISDKPLLKKTDALPKAFIGGGKYNLPQKVGVLYKDDYDYELVNTQLVVTCEGKQETVTDEYFIENYLTNGTTINCSYLYDGEILESTDVPYVRSLDKDLTEEFPIIVNYQNY